MISNHFISNHTQHWVQTIEDHLVMKPSGVCSSRWRIAYTPETHWHVYDFLVDSHVCMLLFDISWYDRATCLRLLSLNKTTSIKTRDLVHIGLEFHVDVHHMVDKYGYAGHQHKQNSTLLIKPQCCMTMC